MIDPSTAGQQPSSPPSAATIDSIFDDARKNPKKYAVRAVTIAVPIVVLVVGFQIWRSHRAETTGALATKWSDLWGSDTTPKARAAALEELSPKISDPGQRAMRLYDLAVTYKELAEQATTQEEKLGYYEKMLATASDLKSSSSNALWARMPTRPPTSASTPTLPAIDQLIDLATRQIAWLKQHPFQTAPEADPGLKVTFELEDGRKIVVGKLFSRSAPYHVQNFVELARRGYYDGTAVSKLGQGYRKGTVAKQGSTPSVIAIEAGHPMTKVTPEDREDDDSAAEIGYSVREEPNPLPIIRGSIVAVQDPQSGGDSPSRFKIYVDEPTYAFETVFAEVTEGLDVIDAITAAPANQTRPTRPSDLVRIKRATVEGSVLAPPERPFPPELTLPDSAPTTRPR
jgi:cyclophilin family peptidyl-prolyl cis-trans isomerase